MGDSGQLSLIVVVHVATGLTFASAVSRKLINPGAFVEAVRRYRILPSKVVTPAAFAIIAAEALISGSHLTGASILIGALSGAFLVGLFMVAVWINLSRRNIVPCGCGGLGSEKLISNRTLVRLMVVLVGEIGIVVALLLWPTTTPAVFWPVKKPSEALIAVGLGIGCVEIVGWLMLFPELSTLVSRRRLAAR